MLRILLLSVLAGVRWTNPAGSHYVDEPDSANARGSFVRDAHLFTVRVESGGFAVSAWDATSGTWKAWSRATSGQPVVAGEMDHVISAGPGAVTVLLDAGGTAEDETVRRCETWSIAIDDAARLLTWTRRGEETRDLASISNYATEAEAYYAALNAARLRAPSSPAHITEDYVVHTATKDGAVAFNVGHGLHVYSLPDRTRGAVRPTHERAFELNAMQIGSTPRGWLMVAMLGAGSWPGKAIVFMDENLEPASVIPLPAGFHSYLEAAGKAQVVFEGEQRFAWVIRGDDVTQVEWSQAIPNGHLAATPDSRWLFLTDGERIAIPVRSAPASRYAAAGLKLGSTTLIVSSRAKTGIAIAIAATVLLLLWLGGVALRRRAAAGARPE